MEKYFLNSKISQYGIKHGRVDYAALASTFQCIRCDNSEIYDAIDGWELINGKNYYYCEGDKEYSVEERDERVNEIQKDIIYLNNRKHTYEYMLIGCDSPYRAARLEKLIKVIEKRIVEYKDVISKLGEKEENTVFYYCIIDKKGAEILSEYTDEIVYYNQKLNVYIWGITCYGTEWDYVLTSIEIDAA